MACVQTPQLNNKNYYVQFDGLEGMSSVTEVWMHGGSAEGQVRRKHEQAGKKLPGLLMSTAIAATDF